MDRWKPWDRRQSRKILGRYRYDDSVTSVSPHTVGGRRLPNHAHLNHRIEQYGPVEDESIWIIWGGVVKRPGPTEFDFYEGNYKRDFHGYSVKSGSGQNSELADVLRRGIWVPYNERGSIRVVGGRAYGVDQKSADGARWLGWGYTTEGTGKSGFLRSTHVLADDSGAKPEPLILYHTSELQGELGDAIHEHDPGRSLTDKIRVSYDVKNRDFSVSAEGVVGA